MSVICSFYWKGGRTLLSCYDCMDLEACIRRTRVSALHSVHPIPIVNLFFFEINN